MRITENRLKMILREEARRVLSEADEKPVLYTGIVVNVPKLRSKLEEENLDESIEDWEFSNIGSHGNEQLNHHMTVTPGALKPDNPLRDKLNSKFTLEIVGWGVDHDLGVAAWKVKAPAGIEVKTGNPHITAALRDPSVKPFMASKIKDWTPIGPFEIEGEFVEVRQKS